MPATTSDDLQSALNQIDFSGVNGGAEIVVWAQDMFHAHSRGPSVDLISIRTPEPQPAAEAGAGADAGGAALPANAVRDLIFGELTRPLSRENDRDIFLFYTLLGCLVQAEEHFIDFEHNGRIGSVLRCFYTDRFERRGGDEQPLSLLELLRVGRGYRPVPYRFERNGAEFRLIWSN
jgi:hypothetical protein